MGMLFPPVGRSIITWWVFHQHSVSWPPSQRQCRSPSKSTDSRMLWPGSRRLFSIKDGERGVYLTTIFSVSKKEPIYITDTIVTMWSLTVKSGLIFLLAQAAAAVPHQPRAEGARPGENLGRGVVAVRSNDTDVLVTWRLLGLDPADIGFNVYRAAAGAEPVRLNNETLSEGTNFVDSTADLDEDNTYFVRAVTDTGEQKADKRSFTLPADSEIGPVVRLPIRDSGPLKFVWVGDLDGDGEYDYVVDRHNEQQSIEAYRSNGEFLWEVNMGENSVNQDNVSPGSSAIDVGHWDGVAVHDLDMDGKADIFLKIANGVKFGDGEVFKQGSDDNDQFFAVLNGLTGALRDYARLPNDYPEDGPMGARLGVGILDGKRPHVAAYTKNRRADKEFNLIYTAWTFDGKSITKEWQWNRDNQTCPDGHHTRVIDVNGDGQDDVVEIGFVLNGDDGSLRYDLGDQGVLHGDRFHITKIDPSRKGLQGYASQQNHPDKLWDFYYNAADGKIIWKHDTDEIGDNGRAMVADIDPSHPGMEVWSLYSGVWDAKADAQIGEPEQQPWPHQAVWWDGDLSRELINDDVLEKWDPENPTESQSVPELFRWRDYGAINPLEEKNPAFFGDILGDWREEIIVTNKDYDELIIFTSDIPTPIRLYTLPHNPAYRNALNEKGYMMTPHVDYFLGHRMKTPPRPNIYYVGA